jgi:hypothetical protein
MSAANATSCSVVVAAADVPCLSMSFLRHMMFEVCCCRTLVPFCRMQEPSESADAEVISKFNKAINTPMGKLLGVLAALVYKNAAQRPGRQEFEGRIAACTPQQAISMHVSKSKHSQYVRTLSQAG